MSQPVKLYFTPADPSSPFLKVVKVGIETVVVELTSDAVYAFDSIETRRKYCTGARRKSSDTFGLHAMCLSPTHGVLSLRAACVSNTRRAFGKLSSADGCFTSVVPLCVLAKTGPDTRPRADEATGTSPQRGKDAAGRSGPSDSEDTVSTFDGISQARR